MFNSNNGYSLSDIAAATGGNNGNRNCDDMWGGNGAWWIIILFLFCFAGWGGGWGGNGNNGATATYIPMYQGTTTREELNYGFDMSDLKSGINGISSTLCNGFAGVNETINANARNLQSDICSMGLTNLQNTNAIEAAITNAHYQTNNQLAAMQAQQAQCCCDTKQLISSSFADLNYNLASQACENRRTTQDAARDVIENANNNTRSILDFLVQDKIDTLNAENAALRSQISQGEQSAYLLSQLRPTAQPSYLVSNPYTGVMTTYGCGYGTGCGCNG